ncbi:hypothetical protein AB0D67_14025 [Streptosporangium sp. NPDC048047]|uniref:hypothetical protein n=1 Tax=Streptosporangium sp. NPDC048047 TaxID=3155748 RepID=UPI00342455B4
MRTDAYFVLPLDWCTTEAERLAKRPETTEQFTEVRFGAGFGPSGLPHIGTLSEIVRTAFLQRSFGELTGRPTRIVMVSDDLDALRKVPESFPRQRMLAEHLGLPLCRVPDPFDEAESLAEGVNRRMLALLADFEIECEFVRSSTAYLSGVYNPTILEFLGAYGAVNELVARSVGVIRRRSYSIFMPISEATGRVIEHIRVLEVDPSTGTITYEIPEDILIQRPGDEYSVEPDEYYEGEPIGVPATVSVLDGRCKLQWKADWAMRLINRSIAYEMHGDDLADSARVVTRICAHLERPVPSFYKYGLFLDDLGRKISKSRGNGFDLGQVDRYLDRASLLGFLRLKPKRNRRFAPVLAPDLCGPAYRKLLRMITACSPVDLFSAREFAVRYLGRAPAELDQVWAYYCDFVRSARPPFVPAPSEAEFLHALGHELSGLNAPITGRVLRALIPEGLYPIVYKALTGAPRGPRLTTWLEITGLERSVDLLRRCAAQTL